MTLPPRNFSRRSQDKRLRSEAHRKFVRTFLCLAWERKDCEGKIDCCHNRDESPEKGMGTRPSDLFCYPCCRRHHREAEKRESAFGKEYGVNVLEMCLELASKSPDRLIREAAKQYMAIRKAAE